MYRVSDDKLYLKKGELLPGLKREWRYNDASDFMYNRAYNGSLKYTLSLPRAGSSPTMSRMLTMISITSARKS